MSDHAEAGPDHVDELTPGDDFGSDGDSAVETGFESTYSLLSTVRRYQEENGRTYHGYEAGKYIFPNDKREQVRLDIDHYLHLLSYKGKLCLCPKYDGAKRVLDMGTGTGLWAIEYADAHPEAEVIGVDLSPIQPEFVPPNCAFEIDDLEKQWTWDKLFDFIHCRNMCGAFADWPDMLQKAYNQLEPGGYFEAAKILWPCRSDDGTLRPDSATLRMAHLFIESGEKLGRSVAMGRDIPRLLEVVGFEDIHTQIFKWPVGRWPKDPDMKEIGTWFQESIDTGVDGVIMASLTRALGWTMEEVVMLCSEVRKEVRDNGIHGYYEMLVTYGRKPL